MNHLLSDRITALPASATISMNEKAASLRAQGLDIINLSIGEPDLKTPLYIQDAAKAAIDTQDYFGYPPIPGYTDLRAAIAEKLMKENNITCSPRQVVVSNGAKQSLSNVFSCLINPGDEVIVYAPYWVSYTSIIQLSGGVPVLLEGNADNNFEPTVAQLQQAITPKTKAILFSSPCNPTGHVFSKEALERIAEVISHYPDILVVADEIYEYINFTDHHFSIGSIEGFQDRVVTINGFSKGFAMTGWRIGYMAAPLWLAKACEKMQGQTTGAPSSIAQRAALAALSNNKEVLQEIKATYKQRRDLCLSLLKEIPSLNCPEPLGGFYLFPEISAYIGSTYGTHHIQDAEALCLYLLEEAQVSLVPGNAFGAPQSVRISYATSEENLTAAIQRIKEVLGKLQSA